MNVRYSKCLAFLLLGIVCLTLGWLWWQPQTEPHPEPPPQRTAVPTNAGLAPSPNPPAPEIEPPPPREEPAVPALAAEPHAPGAASAGVPAREIFGSAWRSETRPSFAAFNEWAGRYLAATAAQRPALIAEGMALAQVRRSALAKMIQQDPRQALAEAVPVMVRTGLPEEVTAALEERVAGRGGLALEGVLGAPGETVAEPTFRTAMVHGTEYRAYTYGRRSDQATKVDISILGVAVGGALAVSESPVRVLEAGETPRPGVAVHAVCPISGQSTPTTAGAPLNTQGATAVEVAGEVQVLCHIEHVALYEKKLIDAENRAGPYPDALTAELTQANGSPGTSGISGRPSLAWSTGTKRVLIIRVDFSDKAGTPAYPYSPYAVIDTAYVTGVFNATNQIADFYAQGSYGQTALAISSSDVTDVLRMPQTASYYAVGNGTSAYNTTLHTDAENLATTAGYTLANYDRIGVVFANLSSNLGGIAGSFITYGGLGDVQGKRFWVNGFFDFRVCAHEIGHNYGLQHCNLWQVNDGDPISANGTSTEYADPFGVMGSGSTDIKFHFDMWEKSILHWIPDTSVTTIAAAGTYRVYRFDHANANTANPLALKIVRNATQDYWIGLRKLFPSNASLSNGAYILWGYNSVVQGNLLDFTTPGTNPQDAALAAGATFHDTTTGVTIHPLPTGGATPNEYLDVQVDFDPHIQWQATTYNVDEQAGAVTLALTRTLNSTGAVSVNFATADGTALAGTHYAAQSGTVAWASGDSTAKTITIPLATNAVFTGLKNFTVTLGALTGGVLVNGATATVNIAAAGAGDSAYHADFVNNTVTRALMQPDGKLVIAGWFGILQDTAYVNYTRKGFARLNADGKVDPAWGNGAGVDATPVYAAALQPDGRVLIGGNFTAVHGTARSRVARLNEDGSLDASFDPGTGANATVRALVLQPDGKVVVGGDFTTLNGTSREYLARLNADGSLDPTFVGPDFAGTSGWHVYALALAPDASAPYFKIIVGGSFYFAGSPFKASLARLSATGALDTAFSTAVGDGAHVLGNTGTLRQINAIAVQRDGKIVIGGNFTAFNSVAHNDLARLTSTGALDDAFTPSADGSVNSLLVEADEKILVGGAFANLNNTASSRFARLNPDGTIDAAFGPGSGSTGQVYDFAMQPDGKVVLAGAYATIQGVSGVTSGRLFTGLPGLPGTVQLSAATSTSIEGNALTVTATRTGGSYGAVSMNYGTQPGTAAATRYTSVNGTLSWSNGDAAAKTFTVPILNDGIAQADQTFSLNLGIPIGGVSPGTPGLATVVVTTGFNAWRVANFTPPELGDATTSGDAADPNRNGFSNLLAYAFGINPKLANPTNTPTFGTQTIGGSDYLTLTFHVVPTAADLTYTPQSGPDIGTWSGAPLLLGTPVMNADGTQTVTYRDDVPITATTPQRFIRLQVTRQP